MNECLDQVKRSFYLQAKPAGELRRALARNVIPEFCFSKISGIFVLSGLTMTAWFLPCLSGMLMRVSMTS